MNLSKRPVTVEDEPFLYSLYRSTRVEETASWNWPTQQLELFLRMQFDAQRRSYVAAYPGADHNLLLRDNQPIGRLLVYRQPSTVRLVDISLLAEHRRQGTGTTVLQEMVEESTVCGNRIQLQVLSASPARRLYARFGFRKISSDGLYDDMEWIPGAVEDSRNGHQLHPGNI